VHCGLYDTDPEFPSGSDKNFEDFLAGIQTGFPEFFSNGDWPLDFCFIKTNHQQSPTITFAPDRGFGPGSHFAGFPLKSHRWSATAAQIGASTADVRNPVKRPNFSWITLNANALSIIPLQTGRR
jgi:hypothetical protein